ncbi:DUF5808 domain-containing protein [Desulfitobacterium sp. AusDCA]|uniref:DUF5808 domain-containing protein n=1 Tax=Desulfitobacterium sp. AusDCA TaxID=3240383 RepID=UPI003DA6FC1E
MARRKWTKEEIEEYRKIHGAFLYCNKEDSNILVPKAYGIGRTVNWANPVSWIFILAIIIFIVIRKFFS